MDYNIKDVEKTVSELKRRVDELERLLEGKERHEFKYSAAEQLYQQRVTRLNTKAGESHTDWESVPIVTESGDVLPDGDATNKYLIWDTVTESWLAAECDALPDGDATNTHLVWDNTAKEWKNGVIVPAGTNVGDLLYWNGTAWAVFARPATGNYFVMYIGGTLSVVEGAAFTCPV